MATTTAYDVAAKLVAEQHAAGRTVDKMQLQKLLYLVQGAHLTFWGVPAFGDPFAAYSYGPVVRGVERTYRDAFPDTNTVPRAVGGHPERLDRETVDTVTTVLRYYGAWAGPDLTAHIKGAESPWSRARGDLAAGAGSARQIPVADIASWFHEHGVDPDSAPLEPWEPTPADLEAAAQRLAEAKAHGAYTTVVDDRMRAVAEAVLAARRDGGAA
jgi:uncharacterized phage-associated protein